MNCTCGASDWIEYKPTFAYSARTGLAAILLGPVKRHPRGAVVVCGSCTRQFVVNTFGIRPVLGLVPPAPASTTEAAPEADPDRKPRYSGIDADMRLPGRRNRRAGR